MQDDFKIHPHIKVRLLREWDDLISARDVQQKKLDVAAALLKIEEAQVAGMKAVLARLGLEGREVVPDHIVEERLYRGDHL